ncbi:MAG: hypothetical protein ABI988_14750, partial [Nitrospirota bacterium]
RPSGRRLRGRGIAMPIEYQRDDQRRLIRITMTDPFSFDDLLSQTDRQWAERTWDYAVLYDSRASQHIPPPGELQRLVEHTQMIGGGRSRGPVGVAIPRKSEAVRRGLDLAERSGPLRDIEILLNETQIASWLVRHAARRGPSAQ